MRAFLLMALFWVAMVTPALPASKLFWRHQMGVADLAGCWASRTDNYPISTITSKTICFADGNVAWAHEGFDDESGRRGVDYSGRFTLTPEFLIFDGELLQYRPGTSCSARIAAVVLMIYDCRSESGQAVPDQNFDRVTEGPVFREALEHPEKCLQYEMINQLPADFEDVGHATLLSGLELNEYENRNCRCSAIANPKQAHRCEPLDVAGKRPRRSTALETHRGI